MFGGVETMGGHVPRSLSGNKNSEVLGSLSGNLGRDAPGPRASPSAVESQIGDFVGIRTGPSADPYQNAFWQNPPPVRILRGGVTELICL